MGLYSDRVLPHLVNVALGTKEAGEARRRVCAELKGEVLEIGFGSGLNLPFLPPDVTRLLAVEPSGVGVKLAQARIASSTADVEVVGLDGQRLPLADHSVDAALCTWTLCTIPDAVAAIREVRRVLRPGGELRFVEHGSAPDAQVRVWQDRLDGIQGRLAGGCHLNRDITSILEAGGMTVTRLDRYYAKGSPKVFGALYEGAAVAS